MTSIDTKQRQTASNARRALAVTGLLALGSGSAALSATALGSLRRGPVDLDGAVAALAALVVAAVLLVWCAGAAATALAVVVRATSTTAGAGQLSRTLDAAGAALTPALLRRLVAALLGASALTGLAGPALAAPRTPDLTWPATATATAAPAPAPAPAQVPSTASTPPVGATPAAGSPDPAAVVVEPGDTLWAIAQRGLPAGSRPADVAAAWPRWFAANRSVIGDDPDLLRPGQRLLAPGTGATP